MDRQPSTRSLSPISAAVALLLAACSSDPGGRCIEWGEGCLCGAEPREDDVPFAGTCDEAGVGARGICCQRGDSCRCAPVLCGISAVDGVCLCGVGLSHESLVASCDGTASTCCTQDTGYCYCEDGCERRFANRLVSSCDTSTSAATCSGDELQVARCE